MPILKASKKGLKQSIKNAARNRFFRVKLKDSIKQFNDLVDIKDTKGAVTSISSLYSNVDTAVKKHLLQANKGAHLKSQAARGLKSIGGDMLKVTARKISYTVSKTTKKPMKTTKKLVK